MKYFIMTMVALIASVEASVAAIHYKGDFNNDGKVDMADMVVLAKAIDSGNADKGYDINASGKVDDNDLHTLANLILNKTLIKDDGLNIGIGDWDDSGEDWGGIVRAPELKTGSVAQVSFMGNLRYDYPNDRPYVEFGLEDTSEDLCGMLLNIELPYGVSVDENSPIEISGTTDLFDGHKMYGVPVIKRDNNNQTIRFIIFSPKLKAFKQHHGIIARLYHTGEGWGDLSFNECQSVAAVTGNAETLEQASVFIGEWRYNKINSIAIEQESVPEKVDVGDQFQLRAGIEPYNATIPDVEWGSSDESIAAVDENGMVTVKARGTVTITVRTVDGSNKMVSCTITVNSTGIENVMNSGQSVDVFSISGNKIKTKATPQDLQDIPNGIYIVKQGNKSYKTRLPKE